MSLFRKEALRHRYETGWAILETTRKLGFSHFGSRTFPGRIQVGAGEFIASDRPNSILAPTHDDETKTVIVDLTGYDCARFAIRSFPRFARRAIAKAMTAGSRQSIDVEFAGREFDHCGLRPVLGTVSVCQERSMCWGMDLPP